MYTKVNRIIMTRLFSFIILFVLILNPISAQKRIEINNQTPGWLSSMLTYPQQQSFESLKISGYLNSNDVDFINIIINIGNLKSLDLFDVILVEGGTSNNMTIKANTIPSKFLYFRRNKDSAMHKIVLPKDVNYFSDSWIGEYSYVDTISIGCKEIDSNITAGLYDKIRKLILLEGVQKIYSGAFLGYGDSYRNLDGIEPDYYLIDRLPETLTTVEGTGFRSNLKRNILLNPNMDIPSNLIRLGDPTIEYDYYDYSHNEWFNQPITFNRTTINLPDSLEIWNADRYYPSSIFAHEHSACNTNIVCDTLYIPSATKVLRVSIDAKTCIAKGSTPPTKSGIGNIKIDNLIVPKGCLSKYKNYYNNELACGDIKSISELKEVESITIMPSNTPLYVGDSQVISYIINPNDCFNCNLTWNSSDPSVATIDNSGIVTGIKAGKAIITATSSNGISNSCEINILQHVESISFSQNEFEIEALGKTVLLNPQIIPLNASDKSIIWESSSPNICHVSETGVVTALDYGIAIITASTKDGGYKAYCKITVEKGTVNVSSIILDKSELSLTKGKEYALSATVLPNDADNKALTWSSTNPTVATVNNLGVISALSEGEATIIAQAADGSGTIATCNVKVEKEFVYISSMTFNPASITLKNGETQSLNITIIPDNSTNKKLTWSSTDNSVLTVDKEGTVTALSIGHAMVIATTTDGSNISAICDVTVDEMNALSSIKSDNDIKIYANNSTIIIEGNIVDKDICIYSLDGRLIHQSIADTMRIEIPLNSKGIYAVKIGEKVAKLAVR